MIRTASIFACSEGGIGDDAMGLRLRRPATVLGGAVVLRGGSGRAMVGSAGEEESAIVNGDEES